MIHLDLNNIDKEDLRKFLRFGASTWEQLKHAEPRPWSRPCQVLESILQEIAKAWAGKARVVKVNADDSLDLSLWYDIQSIPTLLYFVAGKPRLRIVGTASKEAILRKLRRFGLPGESDLVASTALKVGRNPAKEE